MKEKINNFLKITLALAMILCYQSTMAQQIKLVSGRILDKETQKPFQEAVIVYAFNTIAEAQDAKDLLDNQKGVFEYEGKEAADASGFYEIRVAESGALIFKVGVASCILEKVDYRMEINVTIDAGIMLPPIEAVGNFISINPKVKAPTLIGNNLIMRNNFTIPAQFGKDNSRLIIQPYVVSCEKGDTMAYLRPIVVDGKQYRMTQERRMGYNLKNDKLNEYVIKDTLSSKRMDIAWEDTLKVNDPTLSYFGNAIIQFEDYNEVYYSKVARVISCEARRPLKFLQYETPIYDLDLNKYYRKGKRELRNTAANVSLTFLINKAIIDNKNPNNEILLNNLKENLLNIINCEECKLKKIQVIGVSSPDGNYNFNYTLAKHRAAFAKQKLYELLPSGSLDRTFLPSPQVQVANWEKLFPYLESDSCKQAIKDIENIIAKHPKSINRQNLEIKALPYYNTIIKEKLPELRYMRFEYQYEIFRELTAEEIFDRYNTDIDYRNGKKEITLNEYWHLFQMVKDEKELEDLYRRAYRDSKEVEGEPWILPANLLATSYLRRDTVDTSILEPFIDRRTKGVNVIRTKIDGITKEVVNQEEIICNQLNMYLKANNLEQASILAQILPDTKKYEKLKAFTMCLSGYYRGGNDNKERAETKKTFEIVKSSSPINEVIMCLAMDSKGYDLLALEAANKLEYNDPLTWYLKAIVNKRIYGESLDKNSLARYCLIKCWSLDKKYISIAETDGDIGEKLFNDAEDLFKVERDNIDEIIRYYKL